MTKQVLTFSELSVHLCEIVQEVWNLPDPYARKYDVTDTNGIIALGLHVDPEPAEDAEPSPDGCWTMGRYTTEA